MVRFRYGDDGDANDDGANDNLVEAMREALAKHGYSIINTDTLDHITETASYHEAVCDKQRGDVASRERVKDDHDRIHRLAVQAEAVAAAARTMVSATRAEETRASERVQTVCAMIDAKARKALGKKLGFAVGPTSQPTKAELAECRRRYEIIVHDADLVGTLHQLGVITDDEHTYLVQNTTVPAADYAYRGHKP